MILKWQRRKNPSRCPVKRAVDLRLSDTQKIPAQKNLLPGFFFREMISIRRWFKTFSGSPLGRMRERPAKAEMFAPLAEDFAIRQSGSPPPQRAAGTGPLNG